MIDLELKSNIEEFKEDLDMLLIRLKTKSIVNSIEADDLVKLLFEKHFSNSNSFLNNYFHSFKYSTYVGIWYSGMGERNEEKRHQDKSEYCRRVNFLEHVLILFPFVNLFRGKKSNYRNRPDAFSNLAFYFLVKLTELDPEFYFPFDWILFAEGIEINNKLKEDLRKFLVEKEFIEYDLHFDCRISYKGRLFVEERSLNNG